MRLWCFILGLEAEGFVLYQLYEHQNAYSVLVDRPGRRTHIFLDVNNALDVRATDGRSL